MLYRVNHHLRPTKTVSYCERITNMLQKDGKCPRIHQASQNMISPSQRLDIPPS